MINDYKKAVEILTSQGKFHICLGLERVLNVLTLLGNPQEKIKIIHVAGTNGKGSVCSILSSILKSAGYRVGLYTSPHLFEYIERIKVNNENISQVLFAEYVINVCDLAEKNAIHLTEFEILTVAAYKYFYDQKVDIAVIETGLGGRLDATNVIKSNLFSVITSVSIDHKDRLGDSIDKIAFEKAGIIKQGSEVIVDESNLGYEVIKQRAKSMGSTIINANSQVDVLFENGQNYAIIGGKKYEFSLLGLWQKENLKLVSKAIELLNNKGYELNEEALAVGLKTVSWPARMQYLKERNILIDGAHNEDAAKKLIESLDYYFPDMKRIWIYGSLNTKEYEKIVKILFRENDKVYFCEFSNSNSITKKDLKKHINNEIFSIILTKAENTLNYYDQKCLTIVSGSFYMIGEIFGRERL